MNQSDNNTSFDNTDSKKESITIEKDDKSETKTQDPFEKVQNQAAQQPTNVVEELLDRIGVGKFHYITYACVGIAWLTDGAEIVAIGILNFVIVNVVWFRPLSEVGLMGSALFAGFFIGSLLSGAIADKYGRKNPFLIYMVLIFITGAASAAAPNFAFLLVTRAMFGLVVGLIAPASASMLTEITPKKLRGINFVIVSSLFTVGELLAVIIAASLKVEERGSEKWRALLIWVSLPAILSLVIGWKFLDESPRYALMKDADKGLNIFRRMFRMNKKAELYVSPSEKEQAEKWVASQKKHHKKSPAKELLKKGLKKITFIMWFCWWVLSFVYYGISYVLPLVLAKLEQERATPGEESEPVLSYKEIFISIAAELPSYVFAFSVIENKNFGRKQSLFLSFGLAAFSCLAAHLFRDSGFMYAVFFAKFFANSAFEFIYPFTSELYPTNCRATGLGFASAASRIGGIMMPWIIVFTLDINATAPFIVFGIACLAAAALVAMLPYDTAGKELDGHHHHTEEQHKKKDEIELRDNEK